ncbi:MAG: hypothetical protein WD334_03415 [Chitinophagales bacterium]
MPKFEFLGKQMHAPIWISSMTGGTEMAAKINQNLAKACAEFGLGMGLGSCRPLLDSNKRFQDFNLRTIIGNDLPFFANLGIAQIEELLSQNRAEKISELIGKLKADGLIIHVNPLQEWLQPEGDRFKKAPIATIQELLEKTDFPIIVKEVGQGMGYNSLKALMQLPLAAIDFAASGGTNFSKLELLRGSNENSSQFEAWTNIGHTAEEMCLMVNEINRELGSAVQCKEVIVSGGVKNFLDGYYLIKLLNQNAVYGQGSAFLKHAREDYKSLSNFVKQQIEGLKMAKAFLQIKTNRP